MDPITECPTTPKHTGPRFIGTVANGEQTSRVSKSLELIIVQGKNMWMTNSEEKCNLFALLLFCNKILTGGILQKRCMAYGNGSIPPAFTRLARNPLVIGRFSAFVNWN
jgi:hypothetical protein